MSSSSPDPPERQSSSTPLLAHESLESNGSSSNVSSDNEIQENTIHSGNRLRYMRTARRTLSLLASPLTDDRGHWQAVSAGLSTMLVAGAVLGLVLPKNPDFPDLWYRSVSACLGYTYFFCWSVSLCLECAGLYVLCHLLHRLVWVGSHSGLVSRETRC
jgi:hypothetical protein